MGKLLKPEPLDDLGFTYLETKSGEIRISHHGRMVTVIRGKSAQQFSNRVKNLDLIAEQQLMARATRHYKHGNER